MKDNLSVMMAITHDAATNLFAGICPYIFLNTIADKNKIYSGQKVFLYEKRRPLYGCAMVVGEAIINRWYNLTHMEFPERHLLRYWAEFVKEDKELTAWIDRIGTFDLPHYKPNSVFLFALYDDSYLSFMMKNKTLPSTFNDFFYDYKAHPEHGRAREKAKNVLIEFDTWLYYIGFYNKFGEAHVQAAYQVDQIQMYSVPIPIDSYKMENGKPFTRAPQFLTYVK